jgi:hypothetical protein
VSTVSLVGYGQASSCIAGLYHSDELGNFSLLVSHAPLSPSIGRDIEVGTCISIALILCPASITFDEASSDGKHLVLLVSVVLRLGKGRLIGDVRVLVG